jgi:peptide/nickel transport system permease protein
LLPRVPLARLDGAGQMALLVLAALLLVVLFGPMLWSVDPNRTDLRSVFAPPSPATPLGTDEYGRDLLSRLMHGGRLSLAGALAVVCGATVLGLLVGAWAAMAGGRTDAVLSRLVDGLLTLPGLVVALALVGVLGKSFPNLLLALVLTEWPWYARVYRALFLGQAHSTYALAAQALGAHPVRIAWRHLTPNIVGPALVLATANLAAALLGLSSLSFVGLGVEPPQAEWGAMISTSRGYVQTQPWVVALPGLAIGLTVLAASLVGDGLRDLTDPRHQRR